MKNLITLLFLLSAFTSHAQRTLFGGNNNYVAPEIPATLITTDLLLYLDADNPASYPGSGNGNTWYDLSANLNHGTLSTIAIANTASTPKKFTFDGTSGTNVSFNTAKFNVPYTGKTVMFAAKMDASGNLYRALFGSSSGRNFNFYLMQSGPGYKLHFSTASASWANEGSWFSDVVQLATGQWYVFAFTHDATSARFFLNGQLVGTTTGTSILQYQTTPDERLGGGDNFWKGDINTALIYKRGLSNAEILQNFNAIKSRFGL
ncbi:LamG domain-containing protein [Aquirufa lenticrescens]